MSTHWSEKKIAFHQEWSRAKGGKHYMRGDKAKWFQLEAHFLEAEELDSPRADYYLDCAKKFADEADIGFARWDKGKPWFLQA